MGSTSEFTRAFDLASKMPLNIINEIRDWSRALEPTIQRSLQEHAMSGKAQTVRLTLTLTAPDATPLEQELDSLRRRYG